MQRIVLLLCLFASFTLYAHEITSVTQYVNLRRQDTSGWQQDVLGRLTVNSLLDVGVQGTYLERFDIYDKRAGGFVTLRPGDRWTFEARYLIGNGNEILPEKDLFLSAYHSLTHGISPFIFYRNAEYSVTDVHSLQVGTEIEKFRNFIIIPTVMYGKATFSDPAKTENIYSYGLRVTYYKEENFFLSAFGYKGREASQGIVGVSTILVDTTTGGLSGGYYFTQDFKTELVFDHTDYDQLKTEFHTITLNLSRKF